MKKLLTSLFLSLLFVIVTKAQTSTSTPQFAFRTDLIAPSPNAAALGKYGVVPVSLQTGIPDISIPITEAKGQQLKVPITLNYHNNGFKPGEEASWVGLGWSLDAGGVITRVVKDKVDEYVDTKGKYDNTNWRYTNHDSVTNAFLDTAMYFLVDDTEPDIYAYNFAGNSGKFLIYRNKIYQIPYNQLIISGDPSSGFTIVTKDGNQYRFDIPETTNTAHDPNYDPNNPTYVPPTQYNSSWYLNTIHSPDFKDVITFTYATADNIPQNGPVTQSMQVEQLGTAIYTLGKLTFPFPTNVYALRLSKITTSKMVISFNSITARLDIPQSYTLDNIQIKNYQGTLLNQFKFDFNYFSTSSNNPRLKLTV